MDSKRRLKILFICIVLLWVFLAGYKAYLNIFEGDYSGLNAKNLDRILTSLDSRDAFSFAVVGNVRNSVKIFDLRIAPLLREERADFIISAGNAVYDGAEDKYRMLSRSFNRMGLPYLLAVGANEVEDRGTERFYRHFGPLFFSFNVDGACFIFLDSTGETSWSWQRRWLERELNLAKDSSFRFVIMNSSFFKPSRPEAVGPRLVLDSKTGTGLQDLFSKYKVNAVFSGGYCAYDRHELKGVEYFTSGCGGGPIMYKLETLGFFLHSFFYISFFNFLLILGIIGLVAVKVYSLIVRQESLYRDFSIDEKAVSVKPVRVAMFTNNYLPFIGGVPISIHRLYLGLVEKGNPVRIFAPSYGSDEEEEQDVGICRCRTFTQGKRSSFRITNVFSSRIRKELTDFRPDLVHVHHPFWLGWKGRNLARRAGFPVVFTYHTRLERYMHYVPIPGTALKEIAAHFIIKRFANRCDAIIAPTSSTEEYLRRLGVVSLVATIPTGINLREYSRWSAAGVTEFRRRYATDDEILLVSISRMAREKNLDFLIDGVAKVRALTGIPFRCLLVGDGPELVRLEKKVEDLGMNDQILFTGNMEPSDVARACLASDLFVFASTSETQGMVLLEAMAGGCPVVAVSSSGVYDVVEDGFNGFKVPESTDSWAKAVTRLLEDTELRESFSLNSRKFAEKYSEENISEKVLSLYRRVLGLKGAESVRRGGPAVGEGGQGR